MEYSRRRSIVACNDKWPALTAGYDGEQRRSKIIVTIVGLEAHDFAAPIPRCPSWQDPAADKGQSETHSPRRLRIGPLNFRFVDAGPGDGALGVIDDEPRR